MPLRAHKQWHGAQASSGKGVGPWYGGSISMSLEAVIRLDQVSKRYGHRVALNGVTLAVPPGVVFGLLGEK